MKRPMFRVNPAVLCGLLPCLFVGCAHHRQPYAYAPPYAPPVYPQPGMPQQQFPAQPVAYPAASAVQTPLPPGAVVPPTMPVAAPGGYSQVVSPGAIVPTGATMPCPPAYDPCGSPAMVTPVAYEAGVQNQPCPPGM